EQVRSPGMVDGLGAALDGQLLVDGAEVSLDGRLADEEVLADVAIAQTVCHQPHHFDLALAEEIDLVLPGFGRERDSALGGGEYPRHIAAEDAARHQLAEERHDRLAFIDEDAHVSTRAPERQRPIHGIERPDRVPRALMSKRGEHLYLNEVAKPPLCRGLLAYDLEDLERGFRAIVGDEQAHEGQLLEKALVVWRPVGIQIAAIGPAANKLPLALGQAKTRLLG